MSEYDCRAGFGTHSHGRESSADAADSSFDLSVFAKDSLRMLLRLFWLPLLLAVVFSALFCYNAKRSYRPMYKASATFTVNVVGMSGASASYYSKSTAEQFARTFPYILTSGVLRNLICEDLKLKTLPASINAYVEGTTRSSPLKQPLPIPSLRTKFLYLQSTNIRRLQTMLSATRSSRSSALPQFPLHPITASVTQAVSKRVPHSGFFSALQWPLLLPQREKPFAAQPNSNRFSTFAASARCPMSA